MNWELISLTLCCCLVAWKMFDKLSFLIYVIFAIIMVSMSVHY